MEENLTGLNSYKRIPDSIDESIRVAIIKGILKPNSHIDDNYLAEYFATSVSSVRSALLLLEDDGYVTLKRGAGYSVSNLGYDDILHLYQLSSILMKASLFSISTSNEPVMIMLKESLDAQSCPTNIDRDRKFHMTLAIASRNSQYIRATRNTYNKIEWWYKTVFQNDIGTNAVGDHRSIVERLAKIEKNSDYKEKVNEIVDIHFEKHIKEIENYYA